MEGLTDTEQRLYQRARSTNALDEIALSPGEVIDLLEKLASARCHTSDIEELVAGFERDRKQALADLDIATRRAADAQKTLSRLKKIGSINEEVML